MVGLRHALVGRLKLLDFLLSSAFFQEVGESSHGEAPTTRVFLGPGKLQSEDMSRRAKPGENVNDPSQRVKRKMGGLLGVVGIPSRGEQGCPEYRAALGSGSRDLHNYLCWLATFSTPFLRLTEPLYGVHFSLPISSKHNSYLYELSSANCRKGNYERPTYN